MMFNHRGSCLLILVCSASLAFGQEAAHPAERFVQQTDNSNGTVVTYRMTVSPAAEPVPAMRYRLLRRDLDIKQGDAVPFYYRALLLLRNTDVSNRLSEIQDWMDLPQSEFPMEKARDVVSKLDSGPLEQLYEAAHRDRCDWAFNERQMFGPKLFQFLLPEINEMRSWSRLLAFQARVRMSDGEYDKAVTSLRVNYQAAMDTGSSLTLVSKLVGIAMASIGNEQVLRLIASPGSPNLYWAIGELPSPLIDMRPAIRFEMNSALRVFPYLIDAETSHRSAEEWSRLVAESVVQASKLGMSDVNMEKGNWQSQLAAAALVTMAYPQAKRELIKNGMSRESVEAMPAAQVVAIQAERVYRYLSDELEKWWYVPFDQYKSHADPEFWQKVRQQGTPVGHESIALASLLLPAVDACRQAEARSQRDLAAMRVIEAIRMHAAENNGQLPRSLDEIKVVPVPLNPATVKPFVYRVESNKAILELPMSDGFTLGRVFEITIQPDV